MTRARLNTYSLIGSLSFADWSLYARRANPLGSDRRNLHNRSGDDMGGDAMGSVPRRLSAAAWQPMVRAGGPAGSQSAARAKGAERFEGFMQNLGRRLATGDRFLKELSRDIEPGAELQSQQE
ncbi:hypothetical protein [Albidovulum sp.]|uniref:hypothetical protein n=1 Tax=Albidovulum sp. TaxID=1872424 RepID=UPI0039B94892